MPEIILTVLKILFVQGDFMQLIFKFLKKVT